MSKRAFMRVQLVDSTPGCRHGIRTFVAADEPGLGALMHRAYVDTVDYEGETLEQAAAEVRKTIHGEYGEFVPTCSKVGVRAGALVSVTLVTRFQDRPLVAFTFADPAVTGQGLARECMEAVMAELFAQGERELRLAVTLANTPAIKLYTRLGFQLEQGDA